MNFVKRKIYAVHLSLILVSVIHAEYREIILQDKPVAYWRLDGNAEAINGVTKLTIRVQDVEFDLPGPRPKRFPDFGEKNGAAQFGESSTFIRINDPDEKSLFDFHKGDSITIEAWVNPNGIPNNQQVYIIGKGRTNNPGVAPNNQNWALRLRGQKDECCISFLFRNEKNRGGSKSWHRWNTVSGVVPYTGWHHVAVSYTFGHGDSIRGFIDGKEIQGKWDSDPYGGQTDDGPVVDNDEVWIGSSLGGVTSTTFKGAIDEIALYRKILSPERIKARVRIDSSIKPDQGTAIAREDIPAGKVLVQILENVAEKKWSFIRQRPTDQFTQEAFGFSGVPRKYSRQAIIANRSAPFMVRAAALVRLKTGKHQLLIRSMNGARLYVDGQAMATTRFTRPGGGAHQSVPALSSAVFQGMRQMPAGHAEKLVSYEADGEEHLFMLEAFVGGKRLRPEIGELSVSTGQKGKMLHLLTPGSSRIPLTDPAWQAYAAKQRIMLHQMNRERRKIAGATEAGYWEKRHRFAKEEATKKAAPIVPRASTDTPAHNAIDRFVSRRLMAEGVQPAPLTDDYSFLRRVSLDTVGQVPSVKEIKDFLKAPKESRRSNAIERLLEDDRWADHWVSYWQDVLAENPGILKPNLNNTGPFRWWIHESFLDNKPIDRFVTELISMKGSKYGGGPAGFSMATQNDVPMAAKAHIIGQAFLGVQMKCARCHDAPFHQWTQKDLFSTAGMLQRGKVKVPKTSTIQLSEKDLNRLIVDVTLKPGQAISPAWSFQQFIDGAPLSARLLPDSRDTRQLLAAKITSPRNERFAQVIVNRLWKRYLGWGIVEPVDDWEEAEPSHSDLLKYLAHELVTHGYDLKHIARLIFESHTYQRKIVGAKSKPLNKKHHLFASPYRRRFTAEQVVDSMFAIAGKPFNSETLTLDIDGRQSVSTFLNLGNPTRAWEFTSLSNERDRPSLAMPSAQSFNDVLKSFGWRESRQNPVTVREESPTVQQPAILSNGIVSRRIFCLSDDSAFTQLCLEVKSFDELIHETFLRVLTRKPNKPELALFRDLLAKDFEERIVEGEKKSRESIPKPHQVSWSNHLSPEANKIKLEIERAVRAGDPPTKRLATDWRERMEDMIWALVNTPEFVHVP